MTGHNPSARERLLAALDRAEQENELLAAPDNSMVVQMADLRELLRISPAMEGDRERSLQAIGDVVAYWLRWVTKERDAEGLETTADTYIVLANENAPPYWPSVGQLTRWLEVLRATPTLPPSPKGMR